MSFEPTCYLAAVKTSLKSSSLIAALALLMLVESKAQNVETVSVYFNHNESTTQNTNVLDSLFLTLSNSTKAKVIGYTDYRGSAEFNAELSKLRAESVAKYIQKNSKGKLKVTKIAGNGELAPELKSDEGIAANRRVDVIIEIPVQIETKTPVYADEAAAFELDTTVGASLVLEGLSFMPGRHYPLPTSQPALESLVLTMKKYKDLKIEIQGFICCEYNQYDGLDQDTGEPILSKNRAKFVYEYLIQQGIDSERLSYEGYGSSKPKIFPEVTEADMQANRRVEILIVR